MKHNKLYIAILVGVSTSALAKDVVDLGETTVYTQEVKPDEYIKLENNTASIIPLTNKETPQALSTVTQAQMQDLELSTISEVLATSNAVKVEKIEQARWYIRSRGFVVDQVMVDGMGAPSIHDNVYGDIDIAAYDSMDVVRGANGMMNNNGNPSATINLVRKMPTAEPKAKLKLSADQHKGYRVDTDASSNLNQSGTIKGRLVAAYAGGKTYIERTEQDKKVLYGVLSADLTDNVNVSIGHEYNDQRNDGVMWSALEFLDNQGNLIDYDVSESSAANWAFAESTRNNSFIKLNATLAGWYAQLNLENSNLESNSELLYNYPSGNTDPSKNLELVSFPSNYKYETDTQIVSAAADTEFELLGKFHNFGLGAQWSKSNTEDLSTYSSMALPNIDDIRTWDGNSQRPPFDSPGSGSDVDRTEQSVYFNSKLNLVDNLNLFAGGRYTELEYDGTSYRNDWANDYSKFTPAIGLTYDVDATDTTLYVNHNIIFKANNKKNEAGEALDPIEGKTKEIGFKQNINGGRALISAALFETKQVGLPKVAGKRADMTDYYVNDGELTSRGFEVDVSGRLNEAVTLNAGVATARVHDSDDNRVKEGYPSVTANASLSYNPTTLPKLRIGGNVRWENDTHVGIVKQDSYAKLDLFGEYAVNDNVRLKLNIDNVTDEKYIKTLYAGEEFGSNQYYYGEPLTISGSLILSY